VVTGARALAAVDWAEADPLVTGASAVAVVVAMGATVPVTDGRISVAGEATAFVSCARG
jgi:hypothetical protein